MRFHRSTSIVAALVALTACGSPKTFDSASRVQVAGLVAHATDRRPVPHRVSVVVARSGPRPLPATRTIPALRRWYARLALDAWLRGLAEQVRCGGDLPPCYVLMRESGGNPHAQNPISTASCLWQFLDTTWAGFGGYEHAKDAPVSVQNERARIVWANGAGASHWACC